jgi:hypothetical protein
MKNLIKSGLAALIILTANTAMAFEQINNENGYDSAFRNGWVEQSQALPVASFRSHADHELKFNGGSENDTGVITSTSLDTKHHAISNTFDPFSIDYMSKN